VHYYEAHVIVRPPFDESAVRVCADKYGFWVAKLDQDNGDEEKVDDLILTNRYDGLHELSLIVKAVIKALRDNGFAKNIVRYKIEQAVIDSNLRDDLQLGIGVRT
jgi:hypothetical protein